MTGDALVIGIGNEYRSDDGVGLVIAAEVAKRQLPGVEVLSSSSDPGPILDAWTGSPLVIVVDAASGPGAVAGRIRRWNPGEIQQPTGVSSHSLGLPEIYALGQALGRIPERLTVILVEIEDVSHGVGLSTAVAAAVPPAVESVLAELQTVV
ncbi:hydrogenase maturation protease [Mycobacterium sp. EPa45]|uniref:hydrogenase maturation protease n=1 Tax=Mycobacterium sp. EPa45 TaxID=1545728 RepID=UPI000641D40F|nr:hydrogenase maturation protease [Mycobacterium sp. EPa45]AKK27311.1 peptidase M52 [Mycobacterium sp. EPa45]